MVNKKSIDSIYDFNKWNIQFEFKWKYELINEKFNCARVLSGIDPKSVVCAFFKQGQCTKGDKCKFSHDLTIERKAEKRSLYCDMRDDDEDKEADTMDKWDEDKLKEVVEKKHAAATNKATTDIVSSFCLFGKIKKILCLYFSFVFVLADLQTLFGGS